MRAKSPDEKSCVFSCGRAVEDTVEELDFAELDKEDRVGGGGNLPYGLADAGTEPVVVVPRRSKRFESVFLEMELGVGASKVANGFCALGIGGCCSCCMDRN